MSERWQPLRERLEGDSGLRLLALLMATLTYYAVQTETGEEVDFEVPVVVKKERGVAILEQNPMTATVRLRGSQEDLLRVDHRALTIEVTPKPADVESSEALIPLAPGDVQGARYVRPLRVQPPAVRLVFDREAAATLPVAKPKIVGTPLVGKAEVDYEPQVVRLRGPKRRLEELKKAGEGTLQTEPVDVDGRVKSFTRVLRVLPPGDTWVSDIEPSTVTARVSIVTKSAVREWPAVPVRTLAAPGAPRAVALDPPLVQVTVEGTPDVVERLTPESLTVFVDTDGLDGGGTYTLPVTVHVRDATDLRVAVAPDAVKTTLAAPRPEP